MAAATEPGAHLLEELKWVHTAIRHDLGVLTRLAGEVADGKPPAEVEATIRELQRGGPLWQLGVNCLRWCRFVEGHHQGEDVRIFPAIRAQEPGLAEVVDRLEADHREVARHLGEIEVASAALQRVDDAATRQRLVDELQAVTRTLLDHLAREEEAVSPVVLGWSRWPLG